MVTLSFGGALACVARNCPTKQVDSELLVPVQCAASFTFAYCYITATIQVILANLKIDRSVLLLSGLSPRDLANVRCDRSARGLQSAILIHSRIASAHTDTHTHTAGSRTSC